MKHYFNSLTWFAFWSILLWDPTLAPDVIVSFSKSEICLYLKVDFFSVSYKTNIILNGLNITNVF